jgi:glutamate-1-semialdehyde 2,1-aminomutase
VIGKPIGGGVPVAAYGMSASTAAMLEARLGGDDVDVSGIGGTLTGNALALAAVRATLATSLRDEDFAKMFPLAEMWTEGVRNVYETAGLAWHVQRLGCRAEYWFCPPPRNGAQAAAAVDHELDAFMHLFALNRGILLTPFHNMALFSPAHTAGQVDHHTSVFAEAVDALVS